MSANFWAKTGIIIALISLFLSLLAFVFPEGRKCLGLDESEPNEISSICPVTRANYKKLENLLSTQKFQEADTETRKIFQKITGLTKNDFLEAQLMERKVKCQHIQEIDRLWLKYSNKKFGFSVQRRIYWEIPDLDAFGDRVGWRKNRQWLTVNKLTSSLEAPEGHWPSRAPGFPEYPNQKLNAGWMVWEFLDTSSSSDKLSRCLELASNR